MTKEEAQNLGQEKAFLHIEARLAVALDETKKRYGEDVAASVAHIIRLTLPLITAAEHVPPHVLLCAWMETVARWNEQIDEWVRK